MTFFSIMKRFCIEFMEYKDYIYHYIKALEKAKISNTALGYVWWFLDPLLNMGIYVILVRVAFGQKDPNFPIFFFSAMLVWRYFSMSVQQSATSISNNLAVCRDNYVPKFIFPLAVCVSSLTPFLFSLGFLGVLMVLYGLPFTVYILYVPALIIALFLFTWACSMIAAHINVFMNDFTNILPHLIMIGMFTTPIFYNIDTIPQEYIFYMKLNPIGILTTSFRNIFTYGQEPPTMRVLYLTVITIFFIILSIYTLYKNDQVYNRINAR